MDRVKTCANEIYNTNLVFVPSGCTGLLQAPDLSWNKPFKEKYGELYDEWLASGSKTYTSAGNLCPMTKENCMQWVKQAWTSVSKETIIRSFKCAVITISVDRNEDMLVTCLQESPQLAEEVWNLYKPYNCDEETSHNEPEDQGEDDSMLILSEDFDYGFNADSLLQ